MQRPILDRTNQQYDDDNNGMPPQQESPSETHFYDLPLTNDINAKASCPTNDADPEDVGSSCIDASEMHILWDITIRHILHTATTIGVLLLEEHNDDTLAGIERFNVILNPYFLEGDCISKIDETKTPCHNFPHDTVRNDSLAPVHKPFSNPCSLPCKLLMSVLRQITPVILDRCCFLDNHIIGFLATSTQSTQHIYQTRSNITQTTCSNKPHAVEGHVNIISRLGLLDFCALLLISLCRVLEVVFHLSFTENEHLLQEKCKTIIELHLKYLLEKREKWPLWSSEASREFIRRLLDPYVGAFRSLVWACFLLRLPSTQRASYFRVWFEFFQDNEIARTGFKPDGHQLLNGAIEKLKTSAHFKNLQNKRGVSRATKGFYGDFGSWVYHSVLHLGPPLNSCLFLDSAPSITTLLPIISNSLLSGMPFPKEEGSLELDTDNGGNTTKYTENKIESFKSQCHVPAINTLEDKDNGWSPWCLFMETLFKTAHRTELFFEKLVGLVPDKAWEPLANCFLTQSMHINNTPGALQQFLKGLPKANSRCSRVWDGQHVAYRCLTCGLGPASCACVQCFQYGNHEGHDYFIYRSEFGGCCDCGDEGAWKPNGFCPRHKGQVSGDNPCAAIPKSITARLKVLIQVCLRRAFLITFKYGMKPGETLSESSSASQTAITANVSFNRKPRSTSRSTVTQFGSAFSALNAREQRIPSLTNVNNDLLFLNEMQDGMQLSDEAYCGWLVRGLGEYLTVAPSESANEVRLLAQGGMHLATKWLCRMCSWHDGIRRFLCQLTLQFGASSLSLYTLLHKRFAYEGRLPSVPAPTFECFSESLLPLGPQRYCYLRDYDSEATAAATPINQMYPKSSWLELLVKRSTALTDDAFAEAIHFLLELMFDLEFKREFAQIFIKHYDLVAGRDSEFLDRISVQLFSIRSILLSLIEQNNLLDAVFNNAYRILCRAAIPGSKPLQLCPSSPVISERQYAHCLHDLRHTVEASEVLTTAILPRPKFREAFWKRGWIPVFKLTQNLRPHKRLLHEYIRLENPQWSDALILMNDLGQTMSSILTIVDSLQDLSIIEEMAGHAWAALSDWIDEKISAEGNFFWTTHDESPYRFCRYPISSPFLEVSTHIPLHRAFGGLVYLLCLKLTQSPDQVLSQLGLKDPSSKFAWIEHTCRAVALHRQVITAKMWKRNGMCVYFEASFYSRQLGHTLHMEQDYKSLLLFLMSLPPEISFPFLCDKFELNWRTCSARYTEWRPLIVPATLITDDTPIDLRKALERLFIEELSEPDNEVPAFKLIAFIVTLVTLLGAESCLSCTPEAMIEYRLLQTLLGKNKTHGELQKLFPRLHQTLSDKAIKAISEYVPATGMAPGVFVALKDSWTRFDFAYPLHHWSEAQAVEQEFIEMIKKHPDILQRWLPPHRKYLDTFLPFKEPWRRFRQSQILQSFVWFFCVGVANAAAPCRGIMSLLWTRSFDPLSLSVVPEKELGLKQNNKKFLTSYQVDNIALEENITEGLRTAFGFQPFEKACSSRLLYLSIILATRLVLLEVDDMRKSEEANNQYKNLNSPFIDQSRHKLRNWSYKKAQPLNGSDVGEMAPYLSPSILETIIKNFQFTTPSNPFELKKKVTVKSLNPSQDFVRPCHKNNNIASTDIDNNNIEFKPNPLKIDFCLLDVFFGLYCCGLFQEYRIHLYILFHALAQHGNCSKELKDLWTQATRMIIQHDNVSTGSNNYLFALPSSPLPNNPLPWECGVSSQLTNTMASHEAAWKAEVTRRQAKLLEAFRAKQNAFVMFNDDEDINSDGHSDESERHAEVEATCGKLFDLRDDIPATPNRAAMDDTLKTLDPPLQKKDVLDEEKSGEVFASLVSVAERFSKQSVDTMCVICGDPGPVMPQHQRFSNRNKEGLHQKGPLCVLAHVQPSSIGASRRCRMLPYVESVLQSYNIRNNNQWDALANIGIQQQPFSQLERTSASNRVCTNKKDLTSLCTWDKTTAPMKDTKDMEVHDDSNIPSIKEVFAEESFSQDDLDDSDEQQPNRQPDSVTDKKFYGMHRLTEHPTAAGLHVWSCSHHVHFSCYESYEKSILSEAETPVTLTCPYCTRPSNFLLLSASSQPLEYKTAGNSPRLSKMKYQNKLTGSENWIQVTKRVLKSRGRNVVLDWDAYKCFYHKKWKKRISPSISPTSSTSSVTFSATPSLTRGLQKLEKDLRNSCLKLKLFSDSVFTKLRGIMHSSVAIRDDLFPCSITSAPRLDSIHHHRYNSETASPLSPTSGNTVLRHPLGVLAKLISDAIELEEVKARRAHSSSLPGLRVFVLDLLTRCYYTIQEELKKTYVTNGKIITNLSRFTNRPRKHIGRSVSSGSSSKRHNSIRECFVPRPTLRSFDSRTLAMAVLETNEANITPSDDSCSSNVSNNESNDNNTRTPLSPLPTVKCETLNASVFSPKSPFFHYRNTPFKRRRSRGAAPGSPVSSPVMSCFRLYRNELEATCLFLVNLQFICGIGGGGGGDGKFNWKRDNYNIGPWWNDPYVSSLRCLGIQDITYKAFQLPSIRFHLLTRIILAFIGRPILNAHSANGSSGSSCFENSVLSYPTIAGYISFFFLIELFATLFTFWDDSDHFCYLKKHANTETNSVECDDDYFRDMGLTPIGSIIFNTVRKAKLRLVTTTKQKIEREQGLPEHHSSSPSPSLQYMTRQQQRSTKRPSLNLNGNTIGLTSTRPASAPSRQNRSHVLDARLATAIQAARRRAFRITAVSPGTLAYHLRNTAQGEEAYSSLRGSSNRDSFSSPESRYSAILADTTAGLGNLLLASGCGDRPSMTETRKTIYTKDRLSDYLMKGVETSAHYCDPADEFCKTVGYRAFNNQWALPWGLGSYGQVFKSLRQLADVVHMALIPWLRKLHILLSLVDANYPLSVPSVLKPPPTANQKKENQLEAMDPAKLRTECELLLKGLPLPQSIVTFLFEAENNINTTKDPYNKDDLEPLRSILKALQFCTALSLVHTQYSMTSLVPIVTGNSSPGDTLNKNQEPPIIPRHLLTQRHPQVLQLTTVEFELFSSSTGVRWIQLGTFVSPHLQSIHKTHQHSSSLHFYLGEDSRFLLPLAGLYQSFYPSYIHKRIPNADGTLHLPPFAALCLSCGKHVCHGPCCRGPSLLGSMSEGGTPNIILSGIQLHALECTTATGLFLLLYSSQVVVVCVDSVASKLGYLGCLHLDAFGEEDCFLYRGKPLHLSEYRVKKLTTEWLDHSFRLSTSIAWQQEVT